MASTPVSGDTSATIHVSLPVVGIAGTRHVQIALTQQEAAIFTILLDTVQARGLNCTVRVAGGWVRDKLMGRTSHDIDVALDTVTGVEFANAVTAHLISLGEPASSVGVIHANPDQSKHLETATARVKGVWLDFVQLRAESYDPASRIPVVATGTPKQDAVRRDFTINSLLYNLSSGSLEDWTGQGLADLQDGVLRTPIPPAATFTDDPLRVLRAVRFASRFGFRMESSLRAAACDPHVHADLSSKVSRERVGIELDGMLGAAGRPVAALRTLHALGLTGLVLTPTATTLAGHFTLPVSVTDPSTSVFPLDAVQAAQSPTPVLPPSWPVVGLAVLESAAYLCAMSSASPAFASWLTHGPAAPAPFHPSWLAPSGGAQEVTPLVAAVVPWPSLGFHATENPWAGAPECSPDPSDACGLSADDRRLLVLAATLSPMGGLTRVTTKGREESLVQVVLTESVKRRMKDGVDVQAILNGAAALSVCAHHDNPSRLGTGMALRSTAREHWRLSLLLAAAHACVAGLTDPSCRMPHSATHTRVAPASAARIVHALLPFARLRSSIDGWGLDGCWEWKPPVTGAEVSAELLVGLKPGPATGVLLEESMRWQLATRRGGVDGGDAGPVKALVMEHLRQFMEAAGGAEALAQSAQAAAQRPTRA